MGLYPIRHRANNRDIPITEECKNKVPNDQGNKYPENRPEQFLTKLKKKLQIFSPLMSDPSLFL